MNSVEDMMQIIVLSTSQNVANCYSFVNCFEKPQCIQIMKGFCVVKLRENNHEVNIK